MQHKQKKKETIEAVIAVARNGMGYIGKDIEIPHNLLNTALNGDTVLIERSGKKDGEVLRVLERSRDTFVGVLEREQEYLFLVPDDRRMYTDILITDPKGGAPGDKVLVKMHPWKNSRKDPEGKILKIIGRAGEHETEIQSIVLDRGFDLDFPKEVEAEAYKLKEAKEVFLKKESLTRKDFRNTITFTIDPHDAKDFDDALSFKKLENGTIEVGIHIADVSAYIQEGDSIDIEAEDRATSIYLVDRTIPMLPEVLSNDVCSLNPETDKLTFSAVFELNEQGEVLTEWFGETIINSNKRFTYKEAQDTIDKKKGIFFDELNTLNEISKKLREERIKQGSIDFEQDEIEFELDEFGNPIDVLRKERIETNMLIEDFMLLANRRVASYVKDDGVFIYRIHDKPDPERIQDLSIFLKALGYHLETNKGGVTARGINKLFKEIEGEPEEELIKTAGIRSMAKAVYSTKNIGHFGLAFDKYTHFTSPIRRYPDLLVHRLLKRYLKGEKISNQERGKYEKLSVHSSLQEQRAVEAERESIKLKQVEYMATRIGEEFEGIVSGVIDWGIFVQENKTKAEGLVRISNLGNDYYEFDKKQYAILGRRDKEKFTLGDKVKMKLMSVDIKEKQINWKLI